MSAVGDRVTVVGGKGHVGAKGTVTRVSNDYVWLCIDNGPADPVKKAKKSVAKDFSDPSLIPLLDLRRDVAGKRDEVWVARDNEDIYTHATRAETKKPNVDHVTEVQIYELAERGVYETHGPSGLTRTFVDELSSIVNGIENLNVTSAAVNQAKKGPFTQVVNAYHAGRQQVPLSELLRGNARTLQRNGVWENIESAVLDSTRVFQEYVDKHHEHEPRWKTAQDRLLEIVAVMIP